MNGRQIQLPYPPQTGKPSAGKSSTSKAKAAGGGGDWIDQLNSVVEAWLMKNVAPGAIKAGRAVVSETQKAAESWGSGKGSGGNGMPPIGPQGPRTTGKEILEGLEVLKKLFGGGK